MKILTKTKKGNKFQIVHLYQGTDFEANINEENINEIQNHNKALKTTINTKKQKYIHNVTETTLEDRIPF